MPKPAKNFSTSCGGKRDIPLVPPSVHFGMHDVIFSHLSTGLLFRCLRGVSVALLHPPDFDYALLPQFYPGTTDGRRQLQSFLLSESHDRYVLRSTRLYLLIHEKIGADMIL